MATLTRSLLIRPYLFFSRFRRGMTLGARAAVFDADGRILLVRHGYVAGWYLPGGAVEVGETAAEAAKREVLEEGGIRLDSPPELFGFYLNRQGLQRDHVALFLCRSWSQVQPPPRNAEIADSGFFAPDDPPEGTSVGTRRRLSEIMNGGRPADEW
ncbi:NUDIX domain-containing protein [Bauldia sp.]|uniref:NUDIX domain-containing protein n=1 Tax=Bauldia sp. TaxID=2575872 RepID=UPI003BADA8D2